MNWKIVLAVLLCTTTALGFALAAGPRKGTECPSPADFAAGFLQELQAAVEDGYVVGSEPHYVAVLSPGEKVSIGWELGILVYPLGYTKDAYEYQEAFWTDTVPASKVEGGCLLRAIALQQQPGEVQRGCLLRVAEFQRLPAGAVKLGRISPPTAVNRP